MTETSPSNGDDLNDDQLSSRWKHESRQYVSAINDLVRRGYTDGWENIDPQDESKDTRGPLAAAVFNAIQRANETGTTEGLRERFPPASYSFWDILKDDCHVLPVVLFLDDGRIVLRIGPNHEAGRFVIIDDCKLERFPSAITAIGRSPNREHFAFANNKGVTVRRGWDGPECLVLQWSTQLEGVQDAISSNPSKGTPVVTTLMPYNGGDKVLLVGPVGVFVLKSDGAVRLLPTHAQMHDADKSSPCALSMEHAVLSPTGAFIAAGHQDGSHYIFDAETLELVGNVGPQSEYPHHAAFSADGSVLALSSCHLFHGCTIGVPATLLPGLDVDAYELGDSYHLDRRLIQLIKNPVVGDAVSRSDEFIFGDATGYLRAFDLRGKFRWEHYIGPSINCMDISRDGKRMIVTDRAGVLSILDLDTGHADPFAIGTATHHERRRCMFVKSKSMPLVW